MGATGGRLVSRPRMGAVGVVWTRPIRRPSARRVVVVRGVQGASSSVGLKRSASSSSTGSGGAAAIAANKLVRTDHSIVRIDSFLRPVGAPHGGSGGGGGGASSRAQGGIKSGSSGGGGGGGGGGEEDVGEGGEEAVLCGVCALPTTTAPKSARVVRAKGAEAGSGGKSDRVVGGAGDGVEGDSCQCCQKRPLTV
jgi:hypothetical protein